MSFAFDAGEGPIIVKGEIFGRRRTAVVRLALDTGATDTLINIGVLVELGYDPAAAPDRVQVTTGSGVEFAARIPVRRLKALGLERSSFLVLAHTLPPSAGVDGLLGLDFLRGLTLTVDFREGKIVLK
jgi:predicted aspartyl protease